MNSFLFIVWIVLLYMSGWYLVSLMLRRNDVSDVAWGLGFVLIAWVAFWIAHQPPQALIANILVTLWGLRLSWHIYHRNKGKSEDFRYHQWRMEWKNIYLRSFLQVFMLQGFFMYLVALPLLAINFSESQEFHWLHVAGIILWLIGFLFESVGDYQLRKFKANPVNKGKIMKSGLWKYTRHPNYFGDALQWWAIGLMALAYPNGWLALIGPLTMTYLLRYVSGVPMLERKYKGNAEFELYAQKTSPFFPLPPKN